MGIKFNPSSNKYTDFALETLLKLAMQKWEREGKKEDALKMLEQAKGMGLFGDTGSTEGTGSPFEKQPIPSAYMKGLDLESGVPQIGMRSSEDILGLSTQQDLGRLKASEAEMTTGRSIPMTLQGRERFRAMPQDSRASFIKARMANFQPAKRALMELKPRYGGAENYTLGESGKYKETPANQAVIDPETGRIIFTKPKGAVFQPKTKSITDASDLTSEQQLQGRALAKKIYGVRGAEFGLPAVYAEMRKGKGIDAIEDSLRYAGQSKEFSGDIRNAAQTILINAPSDKAQTSMDYIDDLLSKGDMEGTKNQLKRLARTQAGSEEQRAIVGKERTIKLLDEIQGDLNNLERMGINTNIFTGTAEDIAAKVGTVKNPEARKVATKISTAVQNYRRSMTGVQFGLPENKEYQLMFPKIGRTANFNTANINALKEVMSGDLDNFYSLYMGENEYQKLYKSQQQGDVSKTSMAGGATSKGFIAPSSGASGFQATPKGNKFKILK